MKKREVMWYNLHLNLYSSVRQIISPKVWDLILTQSRIFSDYINLKCEVMETLENQLVIDLKDPNDKNI